MLEKCKDPPSSTVDRHCFGFFNLEIVTILNLENLGFTQFHNVWEKSVLWRVGLSKKILYKSTKI